MSDSMTRKSFGVTSCVIGLVLLTCLALFTGCEDEVDIEALKAEEQRLLEAYLQDNNITIQPTATGLYYIQLEPGSGRSPVPGSWVDIQFTGQLVDGSVFETNIDSVARQHRIHDPGFVYGMTRLFVSNITMAGLKEGIQYMAVGETARLIIPSDLGIGGDSRQLIPPYSTLIFDITLLDEFTDPELHQVNQLIDFLGGAQAYADTTLEGIYYFEEEFGWGDTIMTGDEVQVWYTGSFPDGRVFDSNLGGTSLTVYYPDQGDVIPGFMSALKYMRGGAKARVVIPYQHAFGSKGASDGWGQTVVPPYMPLVFDLEIEKVW